MSAMNLIPYFAIWAVLGLTVLALALYRKILTFHGDDEFIHLAEGEQRLIPQQVALSNRLTAIDRWGKILTILTVVTGGLIFAVLLYHAWEVSLRIK
jgi:hypothetical protein